MVLSQNNNNSSNSRQQNVVVDDHQNQPERSQHSAVPAVDQAVVAALAVGQLIELLRTQDVDVVGQKLFKIKRKTIPLMKVMKRKKMKKKMKADKINKYNGN